MKRLSLLGLLVFLGCGSTPRPTADPGALQRTAKAGEQLMFDASASRGSITRYTWDFGDGSDLVEEKTTTHAYASNGDYSATLTVRGPGGAHSASVLVNVGTTCTATAMISVVTSDPQPGAVIIFGSSGSTGCMGAALTSYEWDFGDGSALVTGDSSKQTVSHTYAAMGTYTVKLKVVDGEGNEGRATRSLGVGVINAGKPSVTCAASVNAVTNRALSLTANGTDPGGMQLTYAWTFSDSTTATGSNVMKSFSTAGSYTATVVATTADQRASDPCTTNITVTAPPNYSGNWIISPTASSFNGSCPFSVSFPTAVVGVFHLQSTDGGADFLVVTPNGGSYPPNNELSGYEEMSGSFLATKATPNETPGGTCSSSMATAHRLRMTFTSPTAVTGAWTKTYDGCGSGCLSCNCVAGGATAGAFTGFKQ